MASLTALDMIVILLMGAGATFGFLRGFVQETLSLGLWFLAIIAVKTGHSTVADGLGAKFGMGDGAAAVLALALIFGVIVIGGKLIARKIGAGSRGSMLGPVDRALGVGFGAIKGLLAASLLFLGANLVTDVVWGDDATRPAWMERSRSYPLLQASSRAIVDFVERRRHHDHPVSGPKPADTATDPGAGAGTAPAGTI